MIRSREKTAIAGKGIGTAIFGASALDAVALARRIASDVRVRMIQPVRRLDGTRAYRPVTLQRPLADQCALSLLDRRSRVISSRSQLARPTVLEVADRGVARDLGHACGE